MMRLNSVYNVSVPKYTIARVDLRYRYHSLLQPQVRMQFWSWAGAVEAAVARSDSWKVGSRDVCADGVRITIVDTRSMMITVFPVLGIQSI